MELYPRLYVGKTVNNPDKLIHKLTKHKKKVDAFVITLSKNPYDQLEIYQADCLSQKYYKKNPPYIIGIASNYEEALEIITCIASDSVQTRGDCRLKEYLKCYM